MGFKDKQLPPRVSSLLEMEHLMHSVNLPPQIVELFELNDNRDIPGHYYAFYSIYKMKWFVYYVKQNGEKEMYYTGEESADAAQTIYSIFLEKVFGK